MAGKEGEKRRLFAFGGTARFTLRMRLGPWPDGLESVSENYGGLNDQVPRSFGCGVLDGNLVMIFRQLQSVPPNRSYPFTLLLDPGEDLWTKFAWNSAAVLMAILRQPAASRLLLENVETLNSDSLDRLIDQLNPPDRIHLPLAAMPENALSLWVGASLDGRPLSFSAGEFFLPAGQELEHLAALMEGLLPCFRSARGWLFGESLGMARQLGANLAIERMSTPLTQSSPLPLAGNRLRRAMQWGMQDAACAPLLSSRIEMPFWRWPAISIQEPVEFFSRLEQLQDYASVAVIPEEKDLPVLQQFEDSRPLARELRQAVRSLWLRGGRCLTPSLTRHLLHWSLDLQEPLSENEALLLDEPSLAHDLILRRLNLREARDHLRLQPSVLKQCSLQQLGSAAISEIPSLLLESLSVVSAPGDADDLIPYALKRTGSDYQSWRHVLTAFPDIVLKSQILSGLQRQVRADICQGGNWPAMARDYLSFAGDPSGAWLAMEVPRSQLSSAAFFIAQGLLNLAKHSGDKDCHDARNWLTRLCSSPLRKSVPLAAKLEMARELEGPWNPLDTLHDLVRGEVPKTSITAVSSQEAEFLNAELEELLITVPQHQLNPKTAEIQKLLGSHLAGILKNRLMHILPGPEELFYSDRLFPEDPQPDVTARMEILRKTESAGGVEELKRCLLAALDKISTDRARDSFYRRLIPLERGLLQLFNALDSAHQLKVIEALAGVSGFESLALVYFQIADRRSGSLPADPFRGAVLKYLIAPEGKGVLERITRTEGCMVNSKTIQMLEAQIALDLPSASNRDEGIQKARPKRFFS